MNMSLFNFTGERKENWLVVPSSGLFFSETLPFNFLFAPAQLAQPALPAQPAQLNFWVITICFTFNLIYSTASIVSSW